MSELPRCRRASRARAKARGRFGRCLLLATCLAVACQARALSAHSFGTQPGLIELAGQSDLVVRGTVVRATETSGGSRVTSLAVEKVLKGTLAPAVQPQPGVLPAGKQVSAQGTITFAADPNHGIRYAAGERVVVFLQHSARALVSPQMFGNKFRITSFDPTGYDRFLQEVAAALAIHDRRERSRRLRAAVDAGRRSHERRVRAAAEFMGGLLPQRR